MGYVIAILLCLGDNCDMVRFEPDIVYANYQDCSTASSKNAEALAKFAAAHREQGRESEILCLRQVVQVVELDEEQEAQVPSNVFDSPNGDAKAVGNVARGNKVHVTGSIAGTKWLRISLPNGKSGYIFGDRFRKLSFDEINALTKVASNQPQIPAAIATPPPEQPAARPASPPAASTSQQPQVAVVAPPAPPLPEAKHGEFRDCAQCPVMIPVPAGSFEMGSNGDWSEKPIHRVNVAAFSLAKYMVTQGEWQACLSGEGCGYKADVVNERLPIMNISWDDAQQYIKWIRKVTNKPYRLPSEAEWEYAARAGTATPYPWGSQIGVDKADCSGCGTKGYDSQLPSLVGSYESNGWGFFDMFGGVSEWVEDCWHKDYTGAPINGVAWTAPRCASHVLRGGSWKNPPKDITVSARNYYDTSVRYPGNGLRVALSMQGKAEIESAPMLQHRIARIAPSRVAASGSLELTAGVDE
jgi:formylglycine-generating enzyme required for sulfatase activity